jgi:hypothetical protein
VPGENCLIRRTLFELLAWADCVSCMEEYGNAYRDLEGKPVEKSSPKKLRRD